MTSRMRNVLSLVAVASATVGIRPALAQREKLWAQTRLHSHICHQSMTPRPCELQFTSWRNV